MTRRAVQASETFAGIRIRGAMIDEVRRGDWSPRSVHRNARRVAAGIRNVELRSGGDAGDAAVARELGVEIAEYHAMLQDTLGSRLFSLDELMGEEHGERSGFAAPRSTPRSRLRASAWRERGWAPRSRACPSASGWCCRSAPTTN